MLNELITSVNSDITAFEEVLEKADIAMNYAYNTYMIESDKEELDSITEAVSLDHPEGKAQEGLIGKASRITKKVVASLIEAIKSIFAKIRATIEDVKYKSMIKKAEKVAKENSKLKNKTVKVYDPSHEIKVISQYRDFLEKMKAKVRAGKTDGVMDSISSESENYGRKLAAAKIAAAVTVTMGAAIAMLNKASDNFSDAKEKALVKTAEIKEEFNGKSAEFVNAVVRIQNELAKAAKDEASALSKAMTTAMSAVRDGIIGTTEIKTNDTTAKKDLKDAMESAIDIDDIDALVDSIIKEAEENLAEEDTEALVNEFEENAVDLENFDADKFLDLMTEKFGDEILIREDIIDPIDDIGEIDSSKNVAEFLINNALK